MRLVQRIGQGAAFRILTLNSARVVVSLTGRVSHPAVVPALLGCWYFEGFTHVLAIE